jgi:hypothetical protein
MTSYVATAAADNFRLYRSKLLTNPAADTFDMVKLPKFAFVRDVWLYVVEAGSATDVTLGIKGNGTTADVDYFMTATETAVGTTGWKRSNIVTDFGTSDYGALPFPGLWLTGGAGMVTITAGTLQTTGQYYVFADYTIIH